MHAQPIPRLLSLAQTGAYLGVSERYVEYRRQSADFPHPIRMGRRLLWDRKVLDQWVDAMSGIGEVRQETDEELDALFGL